MTTTITTHTVTVNEYAQKVLTDMGDQCMIAAAVWGHHEPELVSKMHLSLARVLTTLMGRPMGGNTDVSKDGELSLYVVTPAMHMGIIFFRHERPDSPEDSDMSLGTKAPIMARYCFADIGPGDYCKSPYYRGKPSCDGLHTAMPVAVPALGEWSTHS